MIRIEIPRIDVSIVYEGSTKDFHLIDGDRGGIYLIYGENQLKYIGIAQELRKRLRTHRRSNFSRFHPVDKIDVIYCDNKIDRAIYEIYMINKLKPLYNNEHND